jgi:hypothetical protein
MSAKPDARTTQSPVDLQELVRARAYELYEQRGREDGHDLEDWVQAESEIARTKAKATGA